MQLRAHPTITTHSLLGPLRQLLVLCALALLSTCCQVQVDESTPGASLCRNPPAQMLSEYQNLVEAKIQSSCVECHNADGIGRAMAFSGNSRDNFCVSFAMGPGHPDRKLSRYPFEDGHFSVSSRQFSQADLQDLIQWVNRYAR